ncbi:MAG: hypothetical protein LBQ90_01110 [Synergistaceae bacterium]|jgi:hypothetical protein|nr:hypothetical protein [Synergistaceae bacterium]
MKLRAGKGVFALALALLGTAVMIRYALRDMNLDIDLLREGLENMPTLVMENLEFEREISGDYWQVRIPLARRNRGVIEVSSVDIHRWMPNGKGWYFRSRTGSYVEEGGNAELHFLLGTLEMEERVLNLESDFLFWSQETNEFLFPKGFMVYDAEFILEAGTASVDSDGVILLDRGGVIRWTQNGK